MIYFAAACVGGSLGILIHVVVYKLSKSRGLGMLTGAAFGFGVTLLIEHAAGVL